MDRLGPASIAALVLAFALTACSSNQGGAPPGPQTVAYRVGPPDQLMVTILPEPVIQREAMVRPDGMISVDLLGDVAASSATRA
jgi:polysaccharide export outer membrane protein